MIGADCPKSAEDLLPSLAADDPFYGGPYSGSVTL